MTAARDLGTLGEHATRLIGRVTVVAGAVTLATLLTAGADHFVGDTTIYSFYMIAIVAVGFRYGTPSLLLAGIASGLAYAYYFADPPESFAIDRPEVTYGLIIFTVLGVATGRVARYLRVTHRDLRQTRDSLLRRSEELSRTLERELEAIAALKNFIATMCHEFRTPLTTIDIIAQNETRAATARGDGKSVDAHDIIRAEALRIDQLLTSLAQSARTSTLEAPRVSPVFLGDIVREICELQRLTTPSHPIEMLGTWASAPLMGDPQLLRQLFVNLLVNAAKYSPPTAPITVEARPGDRCVEISVTDDGIGIPVDERERVFEQFYRASNTGAVEGTGLGLTLCRQIVKAHGGDIRIAENVPTGTRVTVRLPTSPDRAY